MPDQQSTHFRPVQNHDVDLRTVLRALRRIYAAAALPVAPNPVEALDALRKDGIPPNRWLALLDGNPPRMNRIRPPLRARQTLSRIPVVIPATSSEDGNVPHAYQLPVAGHLVKTITVTNS